MGAGDGMSFNRYHALREVRQLLVSSLEEDLRKAGHKGALVIPTYRDEDKSTWEGPDVARVILKDGQWYEVDVYSYANMDDHVRDAFRGAIIHRANEWKKFDEDVEAAAKERQEQWRESMRDGILRDVKPQ